jgi:predicted nuclease with TOPRIM domain
MDRVSQVNKIKSRIESLDREFSEAQGTVKTLKARLQDEFGVNYEDTNEYLQSLDDELTTLEQKYSETITILEGMLNGF